jgi:hypothetical protein
LALLLTKNTVDSQTIVSAIGLLGIGGVVSSYLTILWQRHSAFQQKKDEFKATRYKATVVLMFGYLQGAKSIEHLNQHGRAFKSKNEILEEVIIEWLNMVLFASDDVLKDLQEFILDPSSETYFRAALAMRKDLWGGRVKFSFKDVKLIVIE